MGDFGYCNGRYSADISKHLQTKSQVIKFWTRKKELLASYLDSQWTDPNEEDPEKGMNQWGTAPVGEESLPASMRGYQGQVFLSSQGMPSSS